MPPALVFPIFILVVAWTEIASAAPRPAPVIQDPRLELQLIAAEPEIVTPIGLAIDAKGRLLVVESHTHFPKTNYAGPKHDRVKLFQDKDGDGRPERSSVFADGFHHAMNLAFSPAGTLYLTHRNGVLRLDDQDGDGISESRQVILEMETPGNYPHNGLGGIAFSPYGWLYIGQGENLGERYTLKGSDGVSLRGHGEGGNVFRCRPDGGKLELFATGFWNPFGLGFYGREFLLALDNDPDSRPPNRLLDVVKHGDYGFKFRFGRSGLHPYQAWNGELPGTLPMVAGTSEAACALLPCDQTRWPADYREAVLVTGSWDHQIELYRPKPFGASLRADREVLVKGGDSFRPVAMAASPDGSVYFTDWVDVSYNVHGQGSIWRLSAKPAAALEKAAPFTAQPNAARQNMQRLLEGDSARAATQVMAGLTDPDPFLRSAAINALARPNLRGAAEKELANPSASIRLGALLALKRSGITNGAPLVHKLLADSDVQVRLMALVWAGEGGMIELTNRLAVALSAGPVSPALLRAHAATEKLLSKPGRVPPERTESAMRVTLLDTAEKVEEEPFIKVLAQAGSETPLQTKLEAVRALALTTHSHALPLLERIAADRKVDVTLRCEAIVALSGDAGKGSFLLSLLEDSSLPVRVEAARALRMHASDPETGKLLRQKWSELKTADPIVAEQLHFALTVRGEKLASTSAPRPASDAEWQSLLEEKGDADSGRRVFFHPAIGCARCHRIEDHGGSLGPDLSTIARGADRLKLIHSILNPSRDLAPQFVSHTVETKDDETFVGLLIGESVESGVTLFMADGRAVIIPPGQVAARTQSKVSLMPEELENALTVQDFRDLLAFLLSRK